MAKFRDIEPFIRAGSYEIDVAINDMEMTLEKWNKSYGVELNPDFQRGRVWTEEQQIAFLEFLFRGGATGRVIYFNSPAFGALDSETELPETIVCVDGLQRLTACLRFVNNEIKAFGHYYREYEDFPRHTMGLKFNVNCLTKREDILEWYLQFNSGGTIHSVQELNRVRELLRLEKEKNNN